MKEKYYLFIVGAGLVAVVFFSLFDIRIVPRSGAPALGGESEASSSSSSSSGEALIDEETIAPGEGVTFSAQWGDLGKQMVEKGVIDQELLEQIYASRGGLTPYEKELLYGEDNKNLFVNKENAPFVLNMLWALGLSNQSRMLDEGPMQDYGDVGSFASTGGWTLAKGDAMDHYSEHQFIILTPDQEELVAKVAQNIYRPCCNNATHFPDCNHGMAMLGFLELLASQGASEEEMYRQALQLNAYWFPGTYVNIAHYLQKKGVAWADADPREVLGFQFSSSSGYRQILAAIQPQSSGGGGSCSV